VSLRGNPTDPEAIRPPPQYPTERLTLESTSFLYTEKRSSKKRVLRARSFRYAQGQVAAKYKFLASCNDELLPRTRSVVRQRRCFSSTRNFCRSLSRKEKIQRGGPRVAVRKTGVSRSPASLRPEPRRTCHCEASMKKPPPQRGLRITFTVIVSDIRYTRRASCSACEAVRATCDREAR
jgi:hypothetical protein